MGKQSIEKIKDIKEVKDLNRKAEALKAEFREINKSISTALEHIQAIGRQAKCEDRQAINEALCSLSAIDMQDSDAEILNTFFDGCSDELDW
jgi:predicted phage gp36 major capsid-like protein